ncbi:unnamed protein product, partial [Thlaspi arvense]
MYNNMGPQPGMPRPPGNPEPGPFGNPFTGAGSGFIRGGLGAYGGRILGSSSEISEPVGGRLSYKPPIYDINAPDLYIPFMAFGTYVVLAGLSLGLNGKFTPEALNWLFVKGLVGWFLQVMLLKITLLSLGSGEAPLLDIVAYGGYAFAGLCLAGFAKIMWGYSYYALMPWTCLCTGVFLVKTMKRVLFAEVRSYDSSKHHYLLLFLALVQFPLLIWLGNI